MKNNPHQYGRVLKKSGKLGKVSKVYQADKIRGKSCIQTFKLKYLHRKELSRKAVTPGTHGLQVPFSKRNGLF